MGLRIEDSQQASWQVLIQEALDKTHLSLNEDMECYLTFLLIRFTKNVNLASTILALEYLESLSLTGSMKQDHLRDVGDKCLLFSGFYPEQAHKKLVSLEYFVNLGRGAYSEIANCNNHNSHFAGLNKLFEDLSSNFLVLLDILHQIKLLNNSHEWMLDEINKFEKQQLQNKSSQTKVPFQYIKPDYFH